MSKRAGRVKDGSEGGGVWVMLQVARQVGVAWTAVVSFIGRGSGRDDCG